MNKWLAEMACVLMLSVDLVVLSQSVADARALDFSRDLTEDQTRCLSQLLVVSDWKYSPRFHKEMMSIAQVATTELDRRGSKSFVYLFEESGWCGTAGCSMLIGEPERDGSCRLLYDGMGETSFTVLQRRDHGYRRIYAPCEARFDGHEYQQVHEECPNPDVHR